MFRWSGWVLGLGWLTFFTVVVVGFTHPRAIAHLFGPDNAYLVLFIWLLAMLGSTCAYGLAFLFRLGMRRQPK
jgi:hypothetical protein